VTVHPSFENFTDLAAFEAALAAREAELNRREAAIGRAERARSLAGEGTARVAPVVAFAVPDETTWWQKQLGLPLEAA
jgi:hypothetical protein